VTNYPPPPRPLSPGGQPLADFGTRLLAQLVDGVILGVAGLLALSPVLYYLVLGVVTDIQTYGPDSEFARGFGRAMLLELLLLPLLLLVQYLYYVEMINRSGQTIGKKVAKVRVVPINPAAPMTRTVAAKRFLVHVLAGSMIPYFNYLDGLWQLWDKPYLQCLHDKFAQTVVVKVSP